jgi:nucleoid-associated protein EbfC
MFDIAKMMKQAQDMTKKMGDIQNELSAIEVTGSAGGGAVTVVCDGQKNPVRISIKPEAMDDRDALEAMVLAALKDAMTQATQLAESKMAPLTQGLKGLNIPGLPF